MCHFAIKSHTSNGSVLLPGKRRVVTDIEDKRTKWSMILIKANEQKKQLKRLQKVQQEYEITFRLPKCTEELKAGLEKRIAIAMKLTLRAQQTYDEITQQLKADAAGMEKHRDWHRKQDDLDEKAMERAKEVASTPKKERTKSEKMKSEKTNSEKTKSEKTKSEKLKSE